MMLKTSLKFLLIVGLILQNTNVLSAESEYLLGLSLEELLEVPILGQGETRQIQDILSEEIRHSIPGSNPLKVLQKLPGVHFQSADPWGNYEWSNKLSIRGFNERQLGFTLDDIPLGAMVYGNSNGLHLGRSIILENIEKIQIAQGSGALGTPSVINLGGTIQLISNDPKSFESIMANQSWGSSNTLRTFLRADTGEINKTKSYISFSRLEADKWKGAGLQVEQNQLNTKFVHEFNEQSISLFANVSQRMEIDYADYSLESAQRLGWNWDNYYPDWESAINISKGIATGNVKLDDAYYTARGLRDDELIGVNGFFKLNEKLDFKTTVYYHHNKGQGHWYTPYFPSSVEIPVSLRTSDYRINRFGIVSHLDWNIENHEISTGLWLEKNQHELGRTFYLVNSAADTGFFLSNPDVTQYKQNFTTLTQQFYIQDTFTQGDLKISLGAKSPKVKTTAESKIGNRAAGELETSDTFLPQIGLNYPLNEKNELFVSYAENARLFSEGRFGPFDATQAVFSQAKERLKPELSDTIDIGWRLKQDKLQASLSLYTVLFKNRLLWISQCSNNISGCQKSFANVGEVKTEGLEATSLWMPFENISWFSAFTYNDSKYQANYLDGTTLVEAAGKTVVDTPKILFSSDVTYENNGYFARLGGKYTGKRYLTYTNDSNVSGFSLWYLSAGYQYKNSNYFNNVRLQFNVDNLFDKRYFSSLGTNGFVSNDPTGLNYTLQQGNSRQFFFSLNFSF